jgi:DNA (cytosine-5)-methyltransferase 1
MENVKGVLSSPVNNSNIFDRILADLSNAGGRDGYELVPFAPRGSRQGSLLEGVTNPVDFVVRGEDHGLPQARHRVIVVGIRRSLINRNTLSQGIAPMKPASYGATVADVLEGMPHLRSGLSRDDSPSNWAAEIRKLVPVVRQAGTWLSRNDRIEFKKRIDQCERVFEQSIEIPCREGRVPAGFGPDCPAPLKRWLRDDRLKALANNETRGHMPSDLARYLFAAIYAESAGVSPKAKDFPEALAPEHSSWRSGKFADRFRVQVFDQPATTVTSHISKDGHYFIHPDPTQCRSLTVREAARLQTFPDNYFFKGNRTEQFIQVGNAVPPLLAKHIGQSLLSLLLS